MRLKSKVIPYLLLLPAFALICMFKIYPIISTLITAFISNGKLTTQVYGDVFATASFWSALKVTVRFNLITIPLQIGISFIMALLVNEKLRGIHLFRTILYLPFCVSLTIAALIWNLMFNYNSGIINSFLSLLHIQPQGFLNSASQALYCIVIIASWRGCGYWMMYLLAGLKNIDGSIYEAAQIDGAGYFKRIWCITLPLIRRVLLFVCVANTTANMLLFAPMQLITNGGPRSSTNVLMYEAYRAAFRYSDMPRSAAIVSVLLFIIILISLVQFFFMGDRKEKGSRRAAL